MYHSSKTQNITGSASFPVIMATLALMILGMALLPLLKVKLLPDRSLPSVSVAFSYGGASAVVVDSEVTSRLEAVFSSKKRTFIKMLFFHNFQETPFYTPRKIRKTAAS